MAPKAAPKAPAAPKAIKLKAPPASKAAAPKDQARETPPGAVKEKAKAPEAKPAAPPGPPVAGVKAKTPAKAPDKGLPEFVRPNVPYVPGVALMSLLYSAQVLLEPSLGSGDLEALEISQKVNNLIDHIRRRTILPDDKA
jgi:hypothetical protein